MLDNEDLGEVCRDEACDLNHVHPCHVYLLRPTKARPWWLDKDPEAYRRPSARVKAEVIWKKEFIDLCTIVQ